MKHSIFLSGVFLSGMLVGGCGQGGPSPSSVIVPPTGRLVTFDRSGVERVLHSFSGGTDGANPTTLVAANGTLYGTTTLGGGATCAEYQNPPGCGTIFRIDASGGGYRVIHRYPDSGRRGSSPYSGVTYADGALYGTTEWGGRTTECSNVNAGCGTVFRVDPSGRHYSILYKFDGADGSAILAGVAYDRGTLFGAAGEGGDKTCYCGLVYALAGGKETILHNFAGGASGGNQPSFAPVVVNRTLYGTTEFGGDTYCFEPDYDGCGTIYKVSTTGHRYDTLYRFKSGKDGSLPNNVIDVNGTLYGTTLLYGGTTCAGPLGYGCGTIFKIGTSGAGYRVIYRFKGGRDGYFPTSLSAGKDDTLYGATTFGGDLRCYSGYGCGTVFRVSTSGAGYHVLYRFKGGADGANPFFFGPIDVNGTLYGATGSGGGSGCGGSGCGTIFAVTQR